MNYPGGMVPRPPEILWLQLGKNVYPVGTGLQPGRLGSSPSVYAVAAVGVQLATPVRLQPGRHATSSPLDTVAVAKAQLTTPVRLQPGRYIIHPTENLLQPG